jgi:GGDEF domain-containing protein
MHAGSPHQLLQENTALRHKVQALEDEITLLKQGKAQALPAILPRPEFIREIARMAAHDQRYGGSSALLVLSFEGLQVMPARLFPAICGILSQHIRACDILGRTGEEDFSLLLTRCKLSDAEKKAEQLVEKIKMQLDPLLAGHRGIALNYAVSVLNSR